MTDRRGRDPARAEGKAALRRDSWALPGGFCECGETTEACCARETLEETGVTVGSETLLGVYSDPKRDPRWHTVTVLYAATPVRGKAKGCDDAAEARWFAKRELEPWTTPSTTGRSFAALTGRRPAKGPARRARRGASRG